MRSTGSVRRGHRPVRAVAAAVLLVLLVPAVALAASDPARSRQWGLDVIGAEQAWQRGQGAGITIAIVDSGVDLDHEDLVDRIVPGYDVVDGDTRADDAYGHGTHVAGIAAATAGNGRGIAGVAPQARIMPVRVLDEEGTGSSSDVTEGVRWAVDHGADVVNLSLGETAQGVVGSSLVDAVRYAWGKGVVVVVAAGNDYVLTSGFGDEPALVVSATTVDDTDPDYSSGVGSAQWGIAAPGGGCRLLTCPLEDDVYSTYWQTGSAGNVYGWSAGTSMAAPHVAGAAAVLLGLGLTPQQTVDRLLSTAHDLGPSGRDSTFGAGRLDLAAATSGLSGGTRQEPDPPSTTPDPDPEPEPEPAATTPSTPSTATGGGDGGAPGTPAPVAVPTPTEAVTTPTPTPAPTPTPGPTDDGSLDLADLGLAGDTEAPADGAPTAVVALASLLLIAAAGGTVAAWQPWSRR